MVKQRIISKVINLSALGLLGLGLLLVDAAPSLAYCGGHCQAGKMCGDMVSKKGVKGDQKREEYQKCMRDPNSYK